MTRIAASATGAVAALIGLGTTLVRADQPTGPDKYPYGPNGMGPYMMEWMGGGYGMFFGPLFMILVLAVVIAAAVVIVRALSGPSHWPPSPAPGGRTALDILKERYARGEIDKNEFEERRRTLGD
ncbi:MAG: SHOCT domain-containing protein [Pseudomonadota bacterium]|nr:SHOCT domain-containing protein [Pseudomonadota bacterium]